MEFLLGERVDQARLQELEAEVDAIVLGVGLGADVDVAYEGDDLDGVWESLPFIERLKTGEPPPSAAALRLSAAGIPRSTSRSRRSVSAPTSRCCSIGGPSTRCRRTSTRSSARREVEIRFLTSPVAFVGDERVEESTCAEMRLGAPDEWPPAPEPVPGSDFVVPVDTVVKAIGQRGDEFAGLLEDVDEQGRTSNPRIFAAGDAVNGGASVVQAVAEAKRAVQALDEALR